MTIIQRALYGYLAWKSKREYDRTIAANRRRLRNTVVEYGDLDRQERAAREKHGPTKQYAKARTALVTELLRRKAVR